jgi:hypothetical protein
VDTRDPARTCVPGEQARHDPTSGALVVGYRLSGTYYFEDDPYPGYQVAILPYQ